MNLKDDFIELHDGVYRQLICNSKLYDVNSIKKIPITNELLNLRFGIMIASIFMDSGQYSRNFTKVLDINLYTDEYAQFMFNFGINDIDCLISTLFNKKELRRTDDKQESVANSHINTITDIDREYDITTIFDCLQKYHDITFLTNIDTTYLVITIPVIGEDGFTDDDFKFFPFRNDNDNVLVFTTNGFITYMRDNLNFGCILHTDAERSIISTQNLFGEYKYNEMFIFKRIDV